MRIEPVLAYLASRGCVAVPMGLMYEATIGPASTPPTVLVGAALITTAGAWIAFSVVSRPSAARAAGAEALRQGCDDPPPSKLPRIHLLLLGWVIKGNRRAEPL
jgi:hypothetical protein